MLPVRSVQYARWRSRACGTRFRILKDLESGEGLRHLREGGINMGISGPEGLELRLGPWAGTILAMVEAPATTRRMGVADHED